VHNAPTDMSASLYLLISFINSTVIDPRGPGLKPPLSLVDYPGGLARMTDLGAQA